MSTHDPIGTHYTYETSEEAYLIATNPKYGMGLYVNEHDETEYFIKAILNDGKYAIGFSLMNSSAKLMYKATQGGGMIRDDETWVSNNEAEIYLVNADAYGFTPFELIYMEYDREINVTLWYREINTTFPVKNKRKPRNKKRH